MKIGIDILGGDFAPDANMSGAVLARKELPTEATLVLLGDKEQIFSGLSALGANPEDFEIILQMLLQCTIIQREQFHKNQIAVLL
jgi:glycerol-3-phosphate acyltransferase PlsX